MKPAEARLQRALDAADPAIRLYILYGPDEATSRTFADRLGKAIGAEGERIDLTSARLKADPALLADEAAAISLFGGRRWIRIDPLTDDALSAIEALLQASVAGNPVAAIGGALRKDAKLMKAVQGRSDVITHQSYLPEGRDAEALAIAIGRSLGVQMRAEEARRLAQASGGDRAILGQEIEKLALYIDAAPERPRAIDGEMLDALGAASEEGDLGRLTQAVFGGQAEAADAELMRLAGEGIEGVPVVRALGRRALLLAQLRAQVAGGDAVDRVMATAGKAVFWKEQDAVKAALQHWTPQALANAAGRLAAAERQIKAAGYPGHALVAETVLAITRHAARRR